MHSDRDHDLFNTAVLTIHSTYSSFSYTPQNSQWTILASFFLTRRTGESAEIKVISLATGTKCLPAVRLSPRGEAVHDSHAEVLVRRCALRWFLEEMHRIRSDESFFSQWIVPRSDSDARYTLRTGVQLNLYVSTVPCGDASMRFLASVQDEDMAALKSTSVFPALHPTAASRGRDNYARLGVLRTKPGRADSPPTLCMSCSDKIARWNVLGIQGALGLHLFEPMYIANMIIGEVPNDIRDVVREDCERAFWGRLDGLEGLPDGFSLHTPTVHFTDIPFIHSRSVLSSTGSCVESLCWTSDNCPFEIIINGLRRGVSPKYRYREKSRPLVSRIAILELYNTVLRASDQSLSDSETYLQLKLSASAYQTARNQLVGEHGPFAGWIATGTQWQNFNSNGETISPP